MYYRFYNVTMQTNLNSWNRNELIDWYCSSGLDGAYRDENSIEELIQEFRKTMSKEEVIDLIKNQL